MGAMTFAEKMEFVNKMLIMTEDMNRATFDSIPDFMMTDENREAIKKSTECQRMYADWVRGVSFELANLTEMIRENNKLLKEINEKLSEQ